MVDFSLYRRPLLVLARPVVRLATDSPRSAAVLDRAEPGALVRGVALLARGVFGPEVSFRVEEPGRAVITFPGSAENEEVSPAELLGALSGLGQLPISVEPLDGSPESFRVNWPPAPSPWSWLLPRLNRSREGRSLADLIRLEYDRVREERARLEGLVSTLRDTLDQRDQALAESEARYRALLEDLSIGVFLLDSTMEVAAASPGASELLGPGRPTVQGASIFELLRPVEPPELEERLRRVVDERIPVVFDARTEGPGPLAEQISTRLQVTLAPFEDGDRVVGSVQRALQPEVSQRLIEAQRLEALGRMASALAHLINNPATSARLDLENACRLAAELEPDPSAGDGPAAALTGALEDAVASVERIAAVLGDLDTFAGERRPQLASCDVDRIVARAVRLLENRLRHLARLDLCFDAHSDVLADEQLLTQALVNLLSNAATAIEQSERVPGTIEVRSLRAGDHVTIEISDTGCGLDPSDLPRLRQPLVSGWRSSPATGLGLATCDRVLAVMGGSLELSPRPAGGTSALVTLPIWAEKEAPQRVSRVPPPPPLPERPRILMVDDERPILRAFTRLLRGSYEVTTAESIDGMEEILERGERFEVVLCDLMMPHRSIVEAYDDLQRRFPWLAQRLVLCTGGGFSDEARRFVKEREIKLLEKPFSPEEFERVLRELGEPGWSRARR